MDILQQFLAYAGDFEKTLADDDWSRLHKYFCDDAVYDAIRIAGVVHAAATALELADA